MPSPKDLKIKIYADGADREGMLALYRGEFVAGFTTNPTLMAKAGIKDYRRFAKEILVAIPDRPISFEVFSDDFEEMERQAREIQTWGRKVYVKIPITNTRGISAGPLVRKLSSAGVQLNVTAILTVDQVAQACEALMPDVPSIVSVFAGRMADTGVDPMPAMRRAVPLCRKLPQCELLWASCREVLNIFQAEECGCDIITAPYDVIKKLPQLGKPLPEVSLDTVRIFYQDATRAGFKL